MDIMGEAAGFFDFGLMIYMLMGVVGVCVVLVIIWKIGVLDRLLKRYQTKVICFENRQNRLLFMGVDRAQSEIDNGTSVYKLKGRGIKVNPPALNLIHNANGENVVFMFFPDRDEGYPLDIQIVTARALIEEATELYKEENNQEPETKEELLQALLLLDKVEKVRFMPVVDESGMNLVMTELQHVEDRYSTRFEKIAKYMPLIAVGFVLLIMIIGYYLIAGKMDDIDFTVTCGTTAVTAMDTIRDTMPVELP